MKQLYAFMALIIGAIILIPPAASASYPYLTIYQYGKNGQGDGGGNFHDRGGRLAMIDSQIQGTTMVYIDGHGLAAGDQIWITTSNDVVHAAAINGWTTIDTDGRFRVRIDTTSDNYCASVRGVISNDLRFLPGKFCSQSSDDFPGDPPGGGPEPSPSPSPGPGVPTVNGNYYYWAPQDLYKYDYTVPAGATRYELHYLRPDGSTQYKRDYEQAPTGVHYLTCNGTYEMRFFDSAGQLIAKSPQMVTSQMVNPTCSSFSGDGGFKDFDSWANPISGGPGSDNGWEIDWDQVPGAVNYKVYRNGQHVMDTQNPGIGTYEDGNYSIVAYDQNGNKIGQSDLTINNPNNPPGENPGNGGGCNGCQFLKDMLACPEWGTYMGDLTEAIRNALPPPPDWDMIADKIGAATIRHLADYMGDVPSVPSKGEIIGNITPPLPPLDTSVPDSDMSPTVPSDFNTPIDYDITTGQVIPVEDESESFEIYDPDKYIRADDPGEMVYPGDSRNHSDGIKEPDRIDTGYTEPTPAPPIIGGPPSPAPPDFEGPPPTEIPIPGDGGSTTPLPTDPGGIIPIPTIP